MVLHLHGIRRRAASWLAAQIRPADPGRDLDRDVEVLEHRRPHLDFFGHEDMRLRFRRHDGTMSAPLERSALLVGAASVVLPYDPLRDRVLLVEQFRAPVYIAGDRAPWVWEPVAGLIDAGETPQQAARREAFEEAGVDLTRLEPVAEVYSSTGSSGEFLHLFVGIADLETLPRGGGGVDAEGEDIVTRLMSFDDLMAAVDARQFADMPLVTVALWLARHRDRLRNGA
jgi:nudix-type nucleoside diphosphatase (YffH/AdpP family)